MKTEFKPYFKLIASFLGLAMLVGVTSALTLPGLTQAAVNVSKIELSVSGPTTVTTGSTVTYTGTLLNNFAGGPLHEPVVTATIPAGMTFISGTSIAEANHSCTQSGAYVVCPSGPNLHQSHSATITLNFKVTAACGLNTSIQMGVTGKLGPQEAWQQVGFPWPVNNVSQVIAIKTPACPTPTPTPIVVAPKLLCTPANQTVNVNQPVSFTANNSKQAVSGIWSAPQGMPATGNATSLTTKYATAGVKTVTVAANGLMAQCQVTVKTVPTPTPTPVVVAPQLFCSPTSQTVLVNQNVTVTASNGQQNITGIWSAPQGLPATGNGMQFTTKYATTGAKTITVAANGLMKQCQVTVKATTIITPTPTPTVTVTPTPGPETTPGPKGDVKKGIEVSKTDNRDTMHPGTVDTYVITVKNTSEIDLKDVKVRDRVPAYLTVTKASEGSHRDGNEVTWDNQSFNPGEIKKFTITATVKDSVANGTIVLNEVTAASADNGVSAKGSDTTKVTRNPQVAGAISVPVTAKTGAGTVGIITTLLGGSGLLTIFRKKA